MSRFAFRPEYDDLNQFAGVDPMLGLMPFNKPMAPASGQQLDPRTLLAALGHPPAGMPTDPNALMALIRDATPRNIPSAAAAPPEFLDALRKLLGWSPPRDGRFTCGPGVGQS
jgi:hypothetical protein